MTKSAQHHPIVHLTVARLRLFFREPGAVFWTFGFPILLTIALGIAFRNRPPEPMAAGIEAGPGAESVRAALAQSQELKVAVLDKEEAELQLRVGRVAILVVPGTPPTYRFDPTRQESRLAQVLVDDALQRALGRADVTTAKTSHVTEPGARYIDFLVPGLIGVNIMSSGMWGIGYAIVETRKAKLLKRMRATPMNRGHFLLSFVFMRLFFLLLELPLLLGFAYLAFDVSVRGSLGLLVGVGVIGALAFAGLGLLVGSRAQNTETVSGLMNVVMMPMYVFSGVFFSYSNFPEFLHPVIRALPLTALNDAMRAIINEGASFASVLPQVGVLVGVAVVTFAVALKVFRWS